MGFWNANYANYAKILGADFADDADFTRYNDGMNPKQMGDFISQTNNAL